MQDFVHQQYDQPYAQTLLSYSGPTYCAGFGFRARATKYTLTRSQSSGSAGQRL